MIPWPIPLPARLLAGLLALLAAAGVGWRLRGDHEDAARLAAERAAHDTYVRTVEGWHAATQEITRQREEERTHAQADRRTWNAALDAARAAGPGGGTGLGPGHAQLGADGDHARNCRDRPAVDRGLWHGALAIGLPDALRPWPPDGPGPAADPAAGATVALDTALENLADNAQACNDLRGLLLDWQAWARSLGAAP
ncbi:MAG: hypothetical protein ACH37Z_18315 [Anaerolineae bacterium]